MPIIKSAKKRVKVAGKAAVRNSKTKRSLKGAIKAFGKALTGKTLSKAHSEVDKAAKKGVMHKNKAARKKSQLAKAAKAAAGVSKKAAPAKKAVVKKAPVKKAAPKKVAAKKPVAKKAVAKKK